MGVSYKLTLRIDQRAADKAGGDIAFREVTTVTRRVLNRGTVLTPVDTGRLRAANQMRVQRSGNTTVGEVWNGTEYARAVHNGTPAQVIVPRRKKALRFVIDGEVIFARRVTLPARRGRPWLLRALREVGAAAGYRFESNRSA